MFHADVLLFQGIGFFIVETFFSEESGSNNRFGNQRNAMRGLFRQSSACCPLSPVLCRLYRNGYHCLPAALICTLLP